jgi:hypothetical protein
MTSVRGGTWHRRNVEEKPMTSTPEEPIAAPDEEHEPDDEPRFAAGADVEDDVVELPQPDADRQGEDDAR